MFGLTPKQVKNGISKFIHCHCLLVKETAEVVEITEGKKKLLVTTPLISGYSPGRLKLSSVSPPAWPAEPVINEHRLIHTILDDPASKEVKHVFLDFDCPIDRSGRGLGHQPCSACHCPRLIQGQDRAISPGVCRSS